MSEIFMTDKVRDWIRFGVERFFRVLIEKINRYK